jgi:hypothetical protein
MRTTKLHIALAALVLLAPFRLSAQPVSPGLAPSSSSPMTSAERQAEVDVTVVWNAFLAAAARGDVGSALRYVNPASPSADRLKSLDAQELKAFAGGQRVFGLKKVYDPFAECIAQVRQPDGTDSLYSILFVRMGTEWLIESM